ncbi:MAG: hypothetical protein WAO91_03060 [Candidatus Nitrosotenuis sp.]
MSAETSAGIFLFSLAMLLAMPVVQAHYVSSDDLNPDYYTAFSFYPSEPPITSEETKVRIDLYNATSGASLTDLNTVHEKKMHVFIVGQDLNEFTHTHPDDYPNGTIGADMGAYEVLHNFTKSGKYLIMSDYTVGGTNVVKKSVFEVSGSEQMGSITDEFYDGSAGYSAMLSSDGPIEVGRESAITIDIMKDGVPIRDLQMYLGSEMHVFIVKYDLSKAGHTHAYRPGHNMHFGNMSQVYYGPTVPIRYNFQDSGRYAMFVMFKHDGNVITKRLFVDVGYSPIGYLFVYGLYGLIAVFAAFMFRDEIVGFFRKIMKRPND